MTSALDLFKIGIGPSSSHTVGPMVATRRFVQQLAQVVELVAVKRVTVELFGSLALTGKGHATDRAVLLGLMGERPESVDLDHAEQEIATTRRALTLRLAGQHLIELDPARDVIWHKRRLLPHHTNALRVTALDDQAHVLLTRDYYSVGGGFVLDDQEAEQQLASGASHNRAATDGQAQGPSYPYPFHSGAELLEQCERTSLSIAELMRCNEDALRPRAQTTEGLQAVWSAMQRSVQRGLAAQGELPGGLRVRRRAAALYRELSERPEAGLRDPLTVMDWVNLYALAVNEENAAGGRVVTAPTNGAAGIVPAVLHYYTRFCAVHERGIEDFLLTAAAIGGLYKRNASISGAEVGCQGEVGVACSMAAAGLAAALGATPLQIEYAAEIGMEHNLGLTCDPIGGLVQIPCIERNAMGAVKAINAQRMAMRGDGRHHVSLDKVIKAMRDTGKDMRRKYKETSQGGLALQVIGVNVIEC